jgi:hypothetical protein
MSCGSSHIGFDDYRFRKVSRKIFKSVDKRRKKKLKERMDALTKTVDNLPPVGYSKSFFHKNELRKAAREREKMKIRLENKMIKSRRKVTGKGIDNVNTSMIHGRSLNNKERALFSHRVNHDNKIISNRIKSAKASINIRQFESEHRRNKRLIMHMSEFSSFRKRKKKKKKKNSPIPWIDPRPQTAPSKFSSSVRGSPYSSSSSISRSVAFDAMASVSKRPKTSHEDLNRERRSQKFRDVVPPLDLELAVRSRIRFDASKDQKSSIWNVHVLELGSCHRVSKRVVKQCCRGIRLIVTRVLSTISNEEEKKKDDISSPDRRKRNNRKLTTREIRDREVEARRLIEMKTREKLMEHQQIFVSIDAAKAICEHNERVSKKLNNLTRVHAFTGKFSRASETLGLGTDIMKEFVDEILSSLRLDSTWHLRVAWNRKSSRGKQAIVESITLFEKKSSSKDKKMKSVSQLETPDDVVSSIASTSSRIHRNEYLKNRDDDEKKISGENTTKQHIIEHKISEGSKTFGSRQVETSTESAQEIENITSTSIEFYTVSFEVGKRLGVSMRDGTIAKITPEVQQRESRLEIGDEFWSVNEIDVSEMNDTEITNTIRSISKGPIEITFRKPSSSEEDETDENDEDEDVNDMLDEYKRLGLK